MVLPIFLFSLILAGCLPENPRVLRLATTTSTDDSGLLAAILPVFEEQYDARVDVIAVGTGQALALGEGGDVDVVLVHARTREDEFIASGHGTTRDDVMYNDFVLVGPADDPAGAHGAVRAEDAFAAIAAAGSPFASRGDDSGTHTRELSLWAAAGLDPGPDQDWHRSLGQGMGETLLFANETGAYTLADRGTFLSMRESLPGLIIIVGGERIAENADPALLNPYGVIPVNPDKGGIAADLAEDFVDWLTGVETQALIGDFGVAVYGQPLFYPDSQPWKSSPTP
ncbi:MAG TPA: substrate-binding domain-containing protein [Anaerolineales bacterium]|nr:substrate-binding domain-containing protein [Anaerolineales bacterium]